MKQYINHTIGYSAEQQALDYLQQQGLSCVTQNYTCKLGEIDLILRDRSTLVFVEVRARSSTQFGTSAESITWHKRTKIIKTATYYLQQHKLLDKVACRFDVIAIQHEAKASQLEWIKDAFQT